MQVMTAFQRYLSLVQIEVFCASNVGETPDYPGMGDSRVRPSNYTSSQLSTPGFELCSQWSSVLAEQST